MAGLSMLANVTEMVWVVPRFIDTGAVTTCGTGDGDGEVAAAFGDIGGGVGAPMPPQFWNPITTRANKQTAPKTQTAFRLTRPPLRSDVRLIGLF
jgi:hypothetical protein